MNLPAEFARQTCRLLGVEEYEMLVDALLQEPPVSIRLNPWKQDRVAPPLSSSLLSPVSWCTDGYYLDRRLTFTFDPLFHAGCYYVQEASSMFLEQAMRQYVTGRVVMLDLCAAPGGKSTHARSLLPEGSLLVSNEVIRSRSQVLSENITKWGHPGVMVTNNDPAAFGKLEGIFDVILADVPCSGEGMFRKDPGAIDEWSLDNVDICRQRQRRIVADVWPGLKPGGIFIYSTCTYNMQENEENITWLMEEFGAEPLQVNLSPQWDIVGNLSGRDFPVYRFLPHKVKGEGFFMAVLRKNDSEGRQRSGGMEDVLRKHLRVIRPPGIEPGVQKGKDVVPSHALAMSVSSGLNRYPVAGLTYGQAIAYLRREAITLDPSVPRGYVLVSYKGVPLGFVKNISNRANNLYPHDWRIRSGYLPENVRVL